MSPDRQLLTTLGALRRQWRQRILLESLVWIGATVLLAVLATMLVLTLFSADGRAPTIARVVGYTLIAAAFIRGLVLPLMKRASDERFALYVEERAPQLEQSLITAVQEAHVPVNERQSGALSARLMSRASAAIAPLQQRAALERPRMVRAVQLLGGVAALAVLMFVAGPDRLREGAKLLFVPFGTAEAAVPIRALSIEPGNAAVPRGGAIEVHAALVGFAADGAELVFRSDSLSEWQRLPMSPEADSSRFRSRLFDISKPTEYYVESADVRSPTYLLTVNDLPAVSNVSLDLSFPAYSGLPAERVEDGGDVAAIVGTTVVVHAKVTRKVASGVLRFDDGTSAPMIIDGDSAVTGRFRVAKSGFYHVDLITTDGTTVAGSVEYVIDAIPDRGPRVTIEEPGRDTKASNTDEVTVAVQASDDLGVVALELRYRVNGGPEKRIVMQDSTTRRPRDARAAHTLFLEEMSLVPGDLVAYHAVAKDGSGHTGSSDVYFLEVRPFSKDYRQAEQQGGGGGGGGGPQGDSPEGFVARQKEVVAGTFNWLRDSSSASSSTATRKRREDITTLTIAEGRLRGDVEKLANSLKERGLAAGDSMFAKIRVETETAASAMKLAEEQLGRGRGTDALPLEQQALQHLQRAEALYRDVQVQMGGGGGGGGSGGGGQKAEDLADLFELETDKLRNQYEAVQQQSQSQQSAQQAVDETIEKLRQLAQRQQQENERMQRQAEAMRQRLGQEQGGGSSGSSGGASSSSGRAQQSGQGQQRAQGQQANSGAQRELARQAEEEARRLERLSREQNNPELANAAQRLQQAADAMRRASSGSAAQGSAALEELNRAARNLEGTRANEVNRGVQQLSDRARELEARQQEIAEGVKSMQGAAPNTRYEQQRRLGEQKDALGSDVRKLEADADRLAREARRDQPKAAGKLGEAAESIRDTRVADKIDFSKQVMRGGSAEYASQFEGQIGENLKDVAERLRAATGSLQGESAARTQERTLERTRALVEGLESLRDRVADKQGQQGGQQGQQGQQSGQQGQPGQRGQQSGQEAQGQGQQSGQGQGQQPGRGQQPGQGQGQQPGQGQGQGEQRGSQANGGRGGNQNGAPRNGGMPSSRDGGQMSLGNNSGSVMPSGTPEQFAREFRLRRENAEGLRREAAAQGVDTRELDRAIEGLRQLENGRAFSDPKGMEQLQTAMLERLKNFEFALYRSVGLGAEGRPAAGARAAAPAEYRALVEEYYRVLAGSKRRP